MRELKIVLTTVGSYGDLHPFIAVALALKARGCNPVIAAATEYRSKVENEGLLFYPVRPTFQQILRDTGLGEREGIMEAAKDAPGFLLEKMVVPYIQQSFDDLCIAMRDADLVIASSLSIVARLAVKKLSKPCVSLLLSPCAFPSAYDLPHLMEYPWLPTIRRVLGLRAARLTMMPSLLGLKRHSQKIADFRHKNGLPAAQHDEVVGEAFNVDWVIAVYSPTLRPLPPDAPKNAIVAGFTFYDSEAGGSVNMPQSLTDFLVSGPAPLVFTLGSVISKVGASFYEMSAQIARQLGMRALLLTGATLEPKLRRFASADIHVAGYAPHSLIFPSAAVIIHHGGIGTVGQALRAGRPQLVCPFLGDQADNAEHLVRLGVAKRLDLKRFTTARAINDLRALLTEGPGAKAKELATQVAQENGARVVADHILKMLSARSPISSVNSLT